MGTLLGRLFKRGPPIPFACFTAKPWLGVLLLIKTASLCIQSGEQAGFGTEIEEVVAGSERCGNRCSWLLSSSGVMARMHKVDRPWHYAERSRQVLWQYGVLTVQWPMIVAAPARLLGLRVRIPPNDMNVCLFWILCFARYRSLRRADPSSGEVLPTVSVCHWVW